MKHFLFLTMTLLLLSCSKEYGYDIDGELIPFFEKFEEEGSFRGMNIDLESEGIGGIIEFIRDSSTVGQCQTSDEGNKRVFIDKAFWEEYDYYEREFIVFHELGHCFLNRTHDDSSDVENNCRSIMQSGSGYCRNNYNQFTREVYLDELFNK